MSTQEEGAVRQAVILAAGRGSRMGELTEHRPKPMLEVGGKTLLEYKFESLPDDVEEVILIVSYLGSVIHDFFGPEFNGRKILYEEQESPTGGTADALWQAKDLLKDRFFVMNGDNLYAPRDVAECEKYQWAVVVQKTDHIRTGSVEVKGGRVAGILENSDHGGGAGFSNTGLYLLDTRIFNYAPIPKAPGSAELGLPQTMMQAAKDIYIEAVPATWWIEIKEPGDLQAAEEFLTRLPQ